MTKILHTQMSESSKIQSPLQQQLLLLFLWLFNRLNFTAKITVAVIGIVTLPDLFWFVHLDIESQHQHYINMWTFSPSTNLFQTQPISRGPPNSRWLLDDFAGRPWGEQPFLQQVAGLHDGQPSQSISDGGRGVLQHCEKFLQCWRRKVLCRDMGIEEAFVSIFSMF